MEDRYVLRDFPVTVTFGQVAARLHLEEEDDLALMEPMFETAKATARPKAAYRICSVDGIEGDRVTIEGREFRSEILAKNLAGIHRVFAYVVTCGREVDDWSHREQDYIVALWLDMIKEMFLGDARRQFVDYIGETYGIPKTASMSPGSGNEDTWPIFQQRPLFDLIGDVEADTGAALTDSFLMLPTKSVSGVLYPSEKTFITCSLCRRENCVGRQAAYAGE